MHATRFSARHWRAAPSSATEFSFLFVRAYRMRVNISRCWHATCLHGRSGKVVSTGTNGNIVQWQAFFFDPAMHLPSPTQRASASAIPGKTAAVFDAISPPPPTQTATSAPAAAQNNSLVGLINARRNHKEDKIQKSLRSRDPSKPTLRRIGHEAPRGDGRVGGVDVFEMDYRVGTTRYFMRG